MRQVQTTPLLDSKNNPLWYHFHRKCIIIKFEYIANSFNPKNIKV